MKQDRNIAIALSVLIALTFTYIGVQCCTSPLYAQVVGETAGATGATGTVGTLATPRPYVPVPAGNTASFLVNTEEELRTALSALSSKDVLILVPGKVTVTKPVYVPSSPRVLTILGTTAQSHIYCPMDFGWWDEAGLFHVNEFGPNGTIVPYNAFEFNNRSLYLRNLEFSGYNGHGALLKLVCTDTVSITDCYFHDIVKDKLRDGRPIARNAATGYVARGQVLAAHANTKLIEVIGCNFYRCVTRYENLSHCMYISADTVVVADNKFTATGNPFGLYAGLFSVPWHWVTGNVCQSPAACLKRDHSGYEQPYLFNIDSAARQNFLNNKISGYWGLMYVGAPSVANHCIDFNDFTGAYYTKYWAADNRNAVWVPFNMLDQNSFDPAHPERYPLRWSEELGFDRNSTFGTSAVPVKMPVTVQILPTM